MQMPCLRLAALVVAVVLLSAAPGAGEVPQTPTIPRGKGYGKAQGKPKPKWHAGIFRNNSIVCKVMGPLWRHGRKLLGDLVPPKLTDDQCSRLHEYYMGPHFHPKISEYGYKVPADCLGYVGIYKSASTETLCNLRNKFGKNKKWAQGMGLNILQRMIQIHMFPVANESNITGTEADPKLKYYEDTPRTLARAEREGRPRHGIGFTWARDPAHRFVSAYSEIEYYLTVGEPYFFYDIVLHSPKARKEYVPGTMANKAKDACKLCSFFNLENSSIQRAERFVLDCLKLGMEPDFLWRHAFPQMAQANTFSRSAGPLDFVCQLESFQRGWDFIGVMTNVSMDPFNRSCRGHDYSGTGAGFGARETMQSSLFGPRGGGSSKTCAAAGGEGSEDCQGEGEAEEATGGAPSAIALGLGCALLLPDYVCFGYKNLVEPEDCVAAGFAKSIETWKKIEKYILVKMCPKARRWIGGLRDTGPVDASTVQEIYAEKRAEGM